VSLDDDVQRFGAKGAVLKYLHEADPSLPILPFVLVPVDERWTHHRREIDALGECLVRSSSPVEDGKTASFAGLFTTRPFRDEYSVHAVLGSRKNPDALLYARNHGIKAPLPMALVFQQDSHAAWNWSIVRHPHKSNLLFIMGRPVPDTFGISTDLVYDERSGRALDVHDYEMKMAYGSQRKHEPLDDTLKEAVAVFKRIEALPAFQTGYAYHMEFGTNPFSIYQFRPFRKKQRPRWRLTKKRVEEIEGDRWASNFGICFGCTPPEGIELTIVRGLNGDGLDKEIRLARELSALPFSQRVVRLAEQWELPPEERPYLEEVLKIPRDVYGVVESQAFERAILRIAERYAPEETCFAQENCHFWYGKDVDLLLPRARAWIAENGGDFLSHRWFRAMQTYDLVLVGSIMGKRTGKRTRIYADGIIGMTIDEK